MTKKDATRESLHFAARRDYEASVKHCMVALEKEAIGDFHGSIAELNLAIKSHPDYALAYTHRGRIYGLLGSFTKALTDLARAIELTPGDDYAHRSRGRIYEMMNRPDKARECFRSAITCFQSKENYIAKIKLEIAQGNKQQAIADAFDAYRHAFEIGTEAGDERKILKDLLGREPTKPEPNRLKIAKALQVLGELESAPQTLTAQEISVITTSRLYEQEYSSLGGIVYESKGVSDDGIWRSVELDLPTASTKRHCLALRVNTSRCNISEKDVKKRLGMAVLAPNRSGGCVVDPAHLTYRRSWGDVTCCFTSAGFQCVTNIVFWMK